MATRPLDYGVSPDRSRIDELGTAAERARATASQVAHRLGLDGEHPPDSESISGTVSAIRPYAETANTASFRANRRTFHAIREVEGAPGFGQLDAQAAEIRELHSDAHRANEVVRLRAQRAARRASPYERAVLAAIERATAEASDTHNRTAPMVGDIPSNRPMSEGHQSALRLIHRYASTARAASDVAGALAGTSVREEPTTSGQ
jgi:hypothetical protein